MSIIAYKGTTEWKCKELRKIKYYKVGETYTYNQTEPIPITFGCANFRQGFHVCTDLRDIIYFYPLRQQKPIILEVEIPDDAKIYKSRLIDSLLIVNKIKILRIISQKEIEEIVKKNRTFIYAHNGKLSYVIDGKYRLEYWYNKRGKLCRIDYCVNRNWSILFESWNNIFKNL